MWYLTSKADTGSLRLAHPTTGPTGNSRKRGSGNGWCVMPENKDISAGEWMAQNGLSWGRKKSPPTTKHAKEASSKTRRQRRGRKIGSEAIGTIKGFVESNRNYDGHDCLFVPAAQEGAPAQVGYLGRNIKAARYMLLLTQGAPKSDNMVARHRCGNGHLSCVNPAHLLWGTAGENIGDMTRHRHAGSDTQDRINSIPE